MERYSFAKITVKGRAGRDVEIRTTVNGHMIASVSVAIDRGTKEKKKTLWLPLKGINTSARAMQHIRKGDVIEAVGVLDLAQWQDKQTGETKEKIEMLVDAVSAQPRQIDSPQNAISEDDLPF